MKKLIVLLTIISLIIISACNQYVSGNIVIQSNNKTQEDKSNLQSSTNQVTASFVIVPPQNSTK